MNIIVLILSIGFIIGIIYWIGFNRGRSGKDIFIHRRYNNRVYENANGHPCSCTCVDCVDARLKRQGIKK